jgi:hypothetical protein
MCGSFSAVLSGSTLVRFTYNFTLQSSGQWQYVTYTVPPPPNAGVITQTTGGGITVDIMSFYIGNLTSVPGTWESGSAMYNFGSTAAVANPWWNNAGNYIEFTGVQLEKGTVATPWDVRPYAQELALCQRYYYQIISPTVAVSGASSQYSIFGVGMNYSTTTGDILINYPVTMRTAVPTFSSSAANTFQAVLPVGSAALTAISGGATDSNTPQTAKVTYTVASGLVAGNAVWIRSNNLTGSSVAYMAFSCEL